MKQKCPICKRWASITQDALFKWHFRHHRNGHGATCNNSWGITQPPNVSRSAR